MSYVRRTMPETWAQSVRYGAQVLASEEHFDHFYFAPNQADLRGRSVDNTPTDAQSVDRFGAVPFDVATRRWVVQSVCVSRSLTSNAWWTGQLTTLQFDGGSVELGGLLNMARPRSVRYLLPQGWDGHLSFGFYNWNNSAVWPLSEVVIRQATQAEVEACERARPQGHGGGMDGNL